MERGTFLYEAWIARWSLLSGFGITISSAALTIVVASLLGMIAQQQVGPMIQRTQVNRATASVAAGRERRQLRMRARVRDVESEVFEFHLSEEPRDAVHTRLKVERLDFKPLAWSAETGRRDVG